MKPLVLSFSASRYPSSTFGEYIRKARLEKGLRQVDVARAIGVDEMTMVNWENANRLPRQYAKLKHLCEELRLDYAGMMDKFGPSPSGQVGFRFGKRG